MRDAQAFPGRALAAPTSPERGGPRALLARAAAATPPPALVLISILSVQLGAALAVELFAALGPAGVVFLSVGFSAVLLLAAARPRLGPELRRHAGPLLLFGAVIAGMNLCFYEAIARIPLGITVTVEFVGPLAVAVATSRRLVDFLWIALAGAGVALLSPEVGGALDPLGLAFAVIAGAGWGCFVLLSRRIGQAFPGNAGLAFGMAIATILLLPAALLGGAAARLDPLVLLGAFAVAVLAATIPFSLEFEALKRLPPRVYGVLVTLEPAVAVAIGVVLLGQAATPRMLLAASCVTAAAIGITFFTRRR